MKTWSIHRFSRRGLLLAPLLFFPGLAASGLLASLAQGQCKPVRWVSDFGYKQGWRVGLHPRLLGDVNGDGRADIVGFGGSKVFVSLSTGTGFTAPKAWLSGTLFTATGGWRTDRHPRFLADVNGDGKADIVGFGDNGVYVALASSGSFRTPGLVIRGWFGYKSGWRVGLHPRMVVDVNGDRRADIVGFGPINRTQAVWMAQSYGLRFGTPRVVEKTNFTPKQGWGPSFPRLLGNVIGDSKPDIVGFAAKETLVAENRLSRFQIAPKSTIPLFFSLAQGWQVGKHPRVLADVNGDGYQDIIGFGQTDLTVALGSKLGFIAKPSLWLKNFYCEAQGWRVASHGRMVTDINGDKKADIVGINGKGIFVSLSNGKGFGAPQSICAKAGWSGPRHAFATADVDGDGHGDAVIFGEDGVYVIPLRVSFPENYGRGCRGSKIKVAPSIRNQGIARLGNNSFGLWVENARSQSIAFAMVGSKANLSLGGGCSLLVKPLIFLPPLLTDGNPRKKQWTGKGLTRIPIPLDNRLRGLVFDAQYLVLDSYGSFQGAAAFSDGLEMKVGGF